MSTAVKEPRTPTADEQRLLDAMTAAQTSDISTIPVLPLSRTLPEDTGEDKNPPTYKPEIYMRGGVPLIRGRSTIKLERNATFCNGFRLIKQGLGRLWVSVKLTWELWTTKRDKR
jgi:hypothetical protein